MEIKLVVIPRAMHDRLLANCDECSREFDCLINALIMKTADRKEEIQIPYVSGPRS